MSTWMAGSPDELVKEHLTLSWLLKNIFMWCEFLKVLIVDVN